MLRQLRAAFKPRPALELRIRALEEMLVLTPQAFELAVCDLLRDMGFRGIRRVGGAGDLGVDITARDEKGRSVAVQCKRYAPQKLIGSRDMQLFIGMTVTHHKVHRKLYVTTSGFTRSAVELANNHRIELIGGDRLTRLLLEYRGAPPESVEEQANVKELLDLAAAGVIDLDKIEFRVSEELLNVELIDEELALMQELTEEEARAAGLPFVRPDFNPAAGHAPPIDCHRCGGTMMWDVRFGGYQCACGRRLAYDGKDFRVISTGSADAVMRGDAAVVRPAAPATSATEAPVNLPDGAQWVAPDGSEWTVMGPLEETRACPNCGVTVEPVWSLPGYHCWACGRSEMRDPFGIHVMNPGAGATATMDASSTQGSDEARAQSLATRAAAEGVPFTQRDRQLVTNGWHADDVIAARRNEIELPDLPPYPTH